MKSHMWSILCFLCVCMFKTHTGCGTKLNCLCGKIIFNYTGCYIYSGRFPTFLNNKINAILLDIHVVRDAPFSSKLKRYYDIQYTYVYFMENYESF